LREIIEYWNRRTDLNIVSKNSSFQRQDFKPTGAPRKIKKIIQPQSLKLSFLEHTKTDISNVTLNAKERSGFNLGGHIVGRNRSVQMFDNAENRTFFAQVIQIVDVETRQPNNQSTLTTFIRCKRFIPLKEVLLGKRKFKCFKLSTIAEYLPLNSFRIQTEAMVQMIESTFSKEKHCYYYNSQNQRELFFGSVCCQQRKKLLF